MLDVIIDNGLKLDHPHIRTMCNKAAQQLGMLYKISSLSDPEKKKLLFNAVIKSRFSYCLLIW